MLEHIKTNFGTEYPGIDVGLTRTFLKGGGEIVPSTAASASKDGGKESFAVADETHLYSSPELKRMHETVRRNLAKRKAADPWMLETSTMYSVGEESIAEQTHRLWISIQEGRTKNQGLLFDHKQAPEVPDLQDSEKLKKALAVVYGPAFKWLDINRLMAEIQDPMTKASDARRYFLNQPSTDTDRYMNVTAWNAAAEPEELIEGTEVVLGYDGSRKDDATVLAVTARSFNSSVGNDHLGPRATAGKYQESKLMKQCEWRSPSTKCTRSGPTLQAGSLTLTLGTPPSQTKSSQFTLPASAS
jgi:phage terminase large subunit-like protein